MNSRRKLLLHVWIQTVLWIVLAIFANHAASSAFARVDLTDDQRYTLSPASREVMGKLDKPLVARMYFTRGLEAPYNEYESTVRAELEELRAYSGGKMTIEVVDPTDDPDKIAEAQRFGVNAIQYRYRARDRAEVKAVFMGVALVYGDRQEAVDPITTLDTLEYDLVRAIHTLETDQKDFKTVGVLQGEGEPDLGQFPADSPMGELRDHIAKNYGLKPVTLGGDLGVPDDVDALLVIGPTQPLSDRALYQLDQAMMAGKPIAFFVTSFKGDFTTFRSGEVRHDLNAFLGHFGVVLGRDVVIDRQHNDVIKLPVISSGKKQLVPVNFPLIVTTTDFNHESPITHGTERGTIPFASTLQVAEPLPQGIEAKVLVKTMDGSTAVEGLHSIRPDIFTHPIPGEKPGPFPIAVSLTGRFKSFFESRDIPPPPVAADGSQAKDDPKSKVVEGEETRLVVVSSADFVANNVPFVLNTVDWMLEDSDLIGIRSRSTGAHVLDAPDAATEWKIELLIVGSPLLALLLLGGTVTALQRRAA